MQRHSLFFIYFILCFVALASTAHGATSLEDKLQKKYQQINTMRTTFTQSLLHRESGSVQNRQGTLIFKKPLNVRWETKAPHAEMLLITDKIIWNYLPDEEVAYKYEPNLMKDMQTLLEVITGQAKMGEDFEVNKIGEKDGLTILQLFPYNPTPEMVEAIIGIETKTTLIKKATIIDFYGNMNTMEFIDIEANAKLDKDAFNFTPPKGVDVEEGALGK